jgi:hypothetical protein
VVPTGESDIARDYWAQYGSLEHDNYFMPLEQLVKAPFTVYIIVQKEGDYVLLPPRVPHQVINKVTP